MRRPGPTRRLSGALHQKGNGLERFWNTHIWPPRLLGERGSSKETSKPHSFPAVTMSRTATSGEESVGDQQNEPPSATRQQPHQHPAAEAGCFMKDSVPAAVGTSSHVSQIRLHRPPFRPSAVAGFRHAPQRPPSFPSRATESSETLVGLYLIAATLHSGPVESEAHGRACWPQEPPSPIALTRAGTPMVGVKTPQL